MIVFLLVRRGEFTASLLDSGRQRESSTVIPLEKNDLGSQDGLGFVAASSALLSMSENVLVVFQSMLSSLLIGSLGGHTLNIHAISKLIDLRR